MIEKTDSEHNENSAFVKIQIKHRFIEAVLFECEAPERMRSELRMRYAVEKAVSSHTNLAGANLAGAYLVGTNLTNADLSGTDLVGANLSYTDLSSANLAGADMRCANLTGANLTNTNLSNANLSYVVLTNANLAGAYLANGVMLLGDRPIFQVGPIGSRCAPLIAYITDKGLRFDAGCQRQLTREKLDEQIALTHGDNKYAREYRAALAMIDVHAEIWTPKADDSGKNQESEQKTQ